MRLSLGLTTLLILTVFPSIASGQITMHWPNPDPIRNPENFRLSFTSGFSVVYPLNTTLPPQYRLYATTRMSRVRWLNPRGRQMPDIFFDTTALPPGSSPHCSNMADPRTWDRRCIETIGLFWKRIGCPPDFDIPCGNNDRWNAYPARDNITAFASVNLWPCILNNPLPGNSCADITGGYGVKGFEPVVNKNKVNSLTLLPFDTNCTGGSAKCPPKTGTAEMCHPDNPDEYATGTSNAKVVQTDSNRWFMAFNYQIHCSFCDGTTASDKWRIMWATSANGETWTVSPQILFRSSSESRGEYQTVPCTEAGAGGPCIGGLLLTDMFVDEGKFYMTFADQPGGPLFMVRSTIDSGSLGYTNWEIAANPVVNGNYTWRSVPLGQKLDFSQAGLNAFRIMPSRQPNPFGLKQTTIGRVFAGVQPGSQFRYIGITADGSYGEPNEYQIWSTTDLSKPFVFESVINIPSNIVLGANSFEPAFTHYADNNSTTPRIVGSGFDFWLVENVNVPWGLVTVTRRTARLTGGIYGS